MLSPAAQSYLPPAHQAPVATPGSKTPAAAPAAANTFKPLAVAVRYESTSATRVELSGGSVSLTHQRTVGVEAYRAIEPAVEAANPFANTILHFIDAQLQRDRAEGASPEELQSRLQAGLDGFKEGYGQAYEQLTAGGPLNEEVRAQIENTRAQVLAGIQALADELGVTLDMGDEEAPAASAPPPMPAPAAVRQDTPAVANPGKQLLSAVLRDVQIVEQYQKATRSTQTYEHLGRAKPAASQSYAYGVKENRDFSLNLRTADGDAVSIRLSAGQTGISQLAYGGGAAQLGLYGEQQAGFAFSVEGELDEGELRALTDLLGQVADVSERFFSGDLERAFELAGNMAFDGSEIAAFDLALHMTRAETAVSRVEQPQWQGSAHKTSVLDAFASSVTKAGDFAQRMGQPRSLVADLLDWVTQSRPWEPRASFLAPAARAFL